MSLTEEKADFESTESSRSSAYSDDDVEPQLKYQRLGGSVTDILKNDSATCLYAHPRLLAMGTQWGMVHILDFNGHEIKKFSSHSKAVNSVSVDASGEFVVSAGQDGLVVVNSLYSNETRMTATFGLPMYGAEMDPNFAKEERRFVAGGADGRLTMNEKGWISSVKSKVLHSEDGPVYALAWRGRFIVWACDKGVMVWDTHLNKRISFINRPKDSPPPDAFRCSLCWKDDRTFIIGWADSIRVAVVKNKLNGDSRGIPGTFVEIIGMFRTEYWVAGVAPYEKDQLVVLAFIPEETLDEDEKDMINEGVVEGDVLQESRAKKPELVIVSLGNDEVSSDALSIMHCEQYTAANYRLAYLEEDSMYFVVSPKDIVFARPRDSDDHVAWLLEHEEYEEALTAAREAEKIKDLMQHTVESVGSAFISHLIDQQAFDTAAKMCVDIAGKDSAAWEKWISVFLKHNQAKVIGAMTPTDDPTLDSKTYTAILLSLINGHLEQFEELRRLVQLWEPKIYDIKCTQTAIMDKLRIVSEGQQTTLLKSSLAEIYIKVGKPAKAIPILLEIKEGDVFGLISTYNFSDLVLEHLTELLELDRTRTLKYLLEHREKIKVETVVALLHKDRFNLFMYLDTLFSVDLRAGAPFHDLQVDLCAEFASDRLMIVLRQSNFYSLEKALHVCRERDLVSETVFLYSRIGNNKQALQLIIDRLNDVHRAIEFAKEQNDAELWDDLIVYSADKPEFIRGLLNNIGTHVDPIVLIRRIPVGMTIPGLRNSLVKIMQDFNLQVSLREGCEKILIADVLTLMNQLMRQRRKGFRLGGDSVCELCDGSLESHAGYDKSFIVFYCKHVYHHDCITSLQGVTDTPSKLDIVTARSTQNDAQMYCPRCQSMESYKHSTPRFKSPSATY
eukprot:CFRG2998T1